MTRGWTYQEAVLSRRLLFFTTLQAYFVCSAMTCCEAVVAGARDTHTGLRGRGHWTGIDVIIHREPIDQTATDLVVFANRIAAFSGRVLAYDADILDAFRGVLSRSPFYTYYGIPLAPCDSAERCRLASDPISTEVGFLRGLYWWAAYDFDLSRRDGFPSWSWSGWKGPVIFLTPFRDPMNHSTVKRPTPKETVWIEDGAGKLLSVSELRALASGGSTILPEISNYIHLDTYILRLRFQRQTSRVYAESSEHWSGYLKDVEAYFCSRHEFEEKWLKWWDCVLIHAMDQPYRPRFFLIVKWQGDTAYRVGSVEIMDSVNRYESYIKPLLRKKRVRLG